MSAKNAFWREVIDYLPNLILVFRVDENDEAQLIFCNKRINEVLGYSAREYVLASESEGSVQDEIHELIDEVARRSHDVEDFKPQLCTLTSKQGKKQTFRINFRLFQTKSAGTNLIAVELTRSTRDQHISTTDKDEKKEKSQSVDWFSRLFVTSSPVMKSVLRKLESASQSNTNMLLRGEPGTGKRTLARKYIYEFGEDPGKVMEIKGEGKESGFEESTYKKMAKPEKLSLLVSHLTQMKRGSQQQLLELLTDREDKNKNTSVVATATENVETLVEEEEFIPELYYKLSFFPVLVPPLRHRKEDIREVTNQYLARCRRCLNLKLPSLSEQHFRILTDQEWEGNFPELFKVLRRSVLDSDPEEFSIKLKEKKQYQLFPEQTISEDEVISFDEMNRRYLSRILELTSGKIYGDDGAASLLDLKPTTLQSKLKRLGLK